MDDIIITIAAAGTATATSIAAVTPSASTAAIRAEVERNMASIATAFENQLDSLYASESMDLSADLTVLQNMLKGKGLGH